jgi:hypothetical protein
LQSSNLRRGSLLGGEYDSLQQPESGQGPAPLDTFAENTDCSFSILPVGVTNGRIVNLLSVRRKKQRKAIAQFSIAAQVALAAANLWF